MGRRSSDSDDDSRSKRKKKQRRRSSSSSSSSSSGSRVRSSRSRRSSRRTRSHSRDRRRRRRSSSSSSHSSSRRRRSRSAERDKGRSHRSHRSRSRDRRDAENIKSSLQYLTPSEQAKARMQMVLQAAAKTDEVLKAKVAKREEEARRKLEDEGTSLEEQVRRIKDIEAIESDSFVPQAFKSSRDDTKTGSAEVKQESLTSSSQDISFPLAIIYDDDDTLAHPSLFMEKETAEELWLNRLISLRQERLMGSPVP
ncbi:serine/Arginine-related protein 53 isoform X3 [Nothobranchius furzeri]|uniref:serine/Arginine-related protein 53 isoform X3 n=1 Tax=Nothobranchius furzeri TaxID=105023 RepID=UPI002403D94B|nr:serine/Arginine-related protein 53 isoform X3 [Nothobranchius furzeri]